MERDSEYIAMDERELRQELSAFRNKVMEAASHLREEIDTGTYTAVQKGYKHFSNILVDYKVFADVYLEEDPDDMDIVFKEARTAYYKYIISQVCILDSTVNIILGESFNSLSLPIHYSRLIRSKDELQVYKSELMNRFFSSEDWKPVKEKIQCNLTRIEDWEYQVKLSAGKLSRSVCVPAATSGEDSLVLYLGEESGAPESAVVSQELLSESKLSRSGCVLSATSGEDSLVLFLGEESGAPESAVVSRELSAGKLSRSVASSAATGDDNSSVSHFVQGSFRDLPHVLSGITSSTGTLIDWSGGALVYQFPFDPGITLVCHM